MRNENKLTYAIVLPAHNEEKFIADALESIVCQTHLPSQLVVVNDNSTDSTAAIIQTYVQKYPFIESTHSEATSNSHEPGSKIVKAFYKGFDKIHADWEVIVKLDADVILPARYFEEILREFSANPKLGIAGGIAQIEKNGKWEFEKIGDKKHVRGPFKAYRKECFEVIGGLKKSIGWDTVDELLAQFHGFEIKVRTDLFVKLQKPTGIQYSSIHAEKTGQGFYLMDYGFLISLIASLKSAWQKKNFSVFFNTLKGYFKSSQEALPKIVTVEEGKFIRKYRWQGILKKLLIRR